MKLARMVDPEFQKALKKLNQSTLPLKVAFKLKGISKVVQEQIIHYEEVRMSALEKHGEKDPEGKVITKEDGNVALSSDGARAFLLEIQELVNMDVEVGTITVAELGDACNLTAEDLFQLDGLVTE